MDFQVDQIDHVELNVADRYEAARWLNYVLGMQIVPEFEFWAEDPKGPLMVSTQTGQTKLALFQGAPQGSRRNVGFHRVAFRVDADGFISFLKRLPDQQVRSHKGQTLVATDVVDHEKAFSIYFCDPSDNQFELTTYDVTEVRKRLPSIGAS